MSSFENQPETVYNPNMPKKNNISDATFMSGVGYVVLIAVAILGVQMLDPGIQRALAIGLLVAFGVIFALGPGNDAPDWKKHLHLAVLTAIIGGLLILQSAFGVFPMLFFILAPVAMMIFPQRVGFIWIGIFTIITGAIFLAVAAPLDAFMALLPFAAGYWFFGTFARAMASAEVARKESQRLLDELQTAHHQLQEYAAQIEELAVAEERNRLSREMHDTLGHRLTVAAVQLEGAQRLIPSDPERAAGMVGTVREQVREALGELRATVATLREPLATDLTITAALSRLVTSFDEATRLTAHLELPDDLPSLPHAHRLALYRAAQESLTNVQRHAQAQQVWVNLQTQKNSIALIISDDGVGFPMDTEETAFGLRGMRERAVHLGGELYLETQDSGGARVKFILPLVKEVDNDREDSSAACR